jgi:hypothetical protein
MFFALIAGERRMHTALVLALLIMLTPAGSAFASETPLVIPRVTRPPKLSDFITNTPREAEAVVTVFKQFDPHDGEPISQPTAAYLSYDSKNLYVGWICKDDPSKIRARVAPRKTIDTDDRVTINIDTFHDNKHAYWFDVNPYGIQYDGRTTDGIGDDPSWEGLWYTEGRITETGFVVLETIPFRSLRFPRGPKQIWNICLARFIQRNSELAIWPFVSRQRLPQFVGQFAPIEIDADISPGRNIQLIPYGLYSQDKYLDQAKGFQHQNEHHPGLDAKAVLHDSLTLDVALNPDFSEIGTDDPKVQVNQRFEVVYPERRPFFLENASIFTMPEDLFFSRRIVDPQFGAKLTGSVGRWGLGILAADDRAPGEVLAQGETGHGDRAIDAVFRGEREFDHQSHVGVFLSDTTFQSRSNRVGSLDMRYIAPRNWIFAGQASTTQTELNPSGYQAGPGYLLNVEKMDNHISFESVYTDRSPGLNATLGYLNRNDIRRWETYSAYQWKPSSHTILAYGPSMDVTLIYDHEHRLQNWSASPALSLTLPGLTWLSVAHSEAFELYSNIGFREQSTSVSLATSWYKWLDFSGSYAQGSAPNYHPAAGVSPFLGKANNASADLTLHAQTHLRLDEIYFYTRLACEPGQMPSPSLPTGDVFTNHLIRSKLNYQFTRDYAFNAILDYNALLPNNALVANASSKQADATLLFAYVPHPGTALYMGYANTFQNANYDPAATPAYTVTNLPGTSTDQQIFVKFSYLLRF